MRSKGFSTVEALLAGSLFSVVVTAIIGVMVVAQTTTYETGERAQAIALAEEGVEAMRSITLSETAFENLAPGNYGVTRTANRWTLVVGNDTSDQFTRTITVANIDASRKQLTVTVDWQALNRPQTLTLEHRLVNWRDTIASWNTPSLVGETSIGATAREVEIIGNYAFVAFAATTNNLRVYDISGSGNPTLVATRSITGTPSNLHADASRNAVYVSSNSDTAEVSVVNVATPTNPVTVSTINLSGTTDARSVYGVGNTLYIGRTNSTEPELHAYNVTNLSAPSQLGTYQASGIILDIYVHEQTAYLATSINTSELISVNITNPAVMTTRVTRDLPTTSDALAVVGNGTNVFIANATLVSAYDASTVTNPVLTDSITIAGTIQDMTIGDGGTKLFTGTNSGADEIDIITITSMSNLTETGSINVTNTGITYGVYFSDILDRLVAVGSHTNRQIQVYREGP